MKKRFLSLLCVLALCLSLLPATALAVAPNGQVIYVGNENVTSGGYWTTSDDGQTITSVGDSQPSSGGYIHYDAGNNTLTLHNATIKQRLDYNESIQGGTYIQGSAIGVFNQNGDAELTITLEGTNTIADVGKGIHVLASSTGGATLTITGGGSLDASASQTGIWVQSNNGNAALTIQNADVTAENSSYSGDGVIVRAGSSSSASLSVDDGSLTATGKNENGAGIRYTFGGGSSGSGKPSLTVSGNAMVKASGGEGGISDNSNTDIQIGVGDNSLGGIVFDGKKGTVYGSVELQKDLEIKSGETLTIPEGSILNTNNNLTNNGTIVNTGGTLNGEPDGTGKIETTPTIDTQPASQTVTKGNTATFTVAATGENLSYQWQQSADNGTNWNNISGATSNSYTTDAATLEMNNYQYQCVVSNSAGSVTSSAATLTVNAATVPVTGVSLTAASLSLFTGDTATLTATVQPSNATNQNVTWSSDKPDVATVDANGKVTAVGEGNTTITVTTVDGSKTATCTVTVTKSTYIISADTTALDFGSAYTGYTQPAAKTVTITNDGNQTLTLNQPASTVSFEVGTLTKTQLAAGEKATFTVQPKAGLAVGTYSENFTVSGDGGATVTITANFTVQRYSSGGGTPTKTPSQQAVDKIESAKDGSTVEIKLSTGSTKLDKEVFEELAGRDVTLEISVPGGIIWTVNGQDIPADADLTDLDLGVSLNTSTIPVSVINTVTGAVDTIQLSLKHDGEFEFTMILSAPLGETNAGYWANLYYYNTRTRALEFQSASKIATDGTASFPFSHASDYAIVIDTDSHEPVELPFTDVPEGAWYEDAAAYVYKHGLMAGTSATTFAPDVTTSRAMIATILWRMAGSPVVNYAMNYTDVTQGQWCSEAIRWATSEGVVTGYGNGLFGTNDPITREQLATMLWRYAQTEDYDVSIGEDTNILSYTDVADLSEYAIPAMQWAVGAGIINGTGDGSTLTPQGQATRAQAAVMLMRFCEEYVVW